MLFRKWGDRPHWEYDAQHLGEDEHGHWVGAATGAFLSRPGVSFHAPSDFVSVLPRDRAFVASFYAAHAGPPDDPVELYVDITTVPAWSTDQAGRTTVTMVDLDLDVLRGRSGRVWVDDEDEFADHRVRFGYPDEIVSLASTTCDAVHADVAARRPPYDGVASQAWLSRLGSSAS